MLRKLTRKDEQLEITTQMLRKAEEEIKEQDTNVVELQRDLARTRDSLGKALRRSGSRDAMAG